MPLPRDVRVALAGPMGAGKSRVGALLAARLRVQFADLDDLTGPAEAIFAREGEVGFRAREREALRAALVGSGVLALGGGTLVAAENREMLRASWRVVVLLAPAPVLRQRVGEGSGRPLASRLDRLLLERASLWAASGPVVSTAGRDIAAVVDELVSLC